MGIFVVVWIAELCILSGALRALQGCADTVKLLDQKLLPSG